MDWGFRPSQFAPPLSPSVAMGRDGQLAPQKFPQSTRTTVHVDSRGRDYTTHPAASEFVIELPETLKNISSAVLVSAELPLSYYVFSAERGNTSLSLKVGAGSTITVTIPDGNYTTATMAAALKAKLDAAFTATSTTFTVTFDAADMKCSITSSSGALTVDTTAAVKNTEWGLGYYLGFPRGVLHTNGTTTARGTAVATMNPENYLLIEIEELNGVSQPALYSTGRNARTYLPDGQPAVAVYAPGGSGRRSFAKVPLNGDSYSYNYYDKTLTYVDVRPQLTKLEKLRVSIRFHDGTIVNLNGGEWSMSLEFACTLTRGL